MTRWPPAAGETVNAGAALPAETALPPGLVVTTIYCVPAGPATPRGIVSILAGGAPGRFGLGDAMTMVCLPPAAGV